MCVCVCVCVCVCADPTANMRVADIKTRTTYDRHYNESAPDVAAQAHDLSRLLVLDAIKFNNEKPFVPGKRHWRRPGICILSLIHI